MTARLLREMRVTYSPGVAGPAKIRGDADAAKIAARIIGEDPREHFVAIYLDGRHSVIGHHVISVGTSTASLVHPRHVFAPAIIANAAAVILAHNHPSGDPAPSSEDRDVTRRLRAAGELLGIRVLDSIVIGDGRHHSFADSGELQQ